MQRCGHFLIFRCWGGNRSRSTWRLVAAVAGQGQRERSQHSLRYGAGSVSATIATARPYLLPVELSITTPLGAWRLTFMQIDTDWSGAKRELVARRSRRRRGLPRRVAMPRRVGPNHVAVRRRHLTGSSRRTFCGAVYELEWAEAETRPSREGVSNSRKNRDSPFAVNDRRRAGGTARTAAATRQDRMCFD